MPPSFWHHALETTIYLLNIFPTKVLRYKSPTQILYNKNPSYSSIRVFGCLSFPLFPSNIINKLQPHSTPCVFLGYSSNHWEYKCYDFSSRKIIISRHVIFDENQFLFSKLHTPTSTSYEFLDIDPSPYLLKNLHQQSNCEPDVHLPKQHNQANSTPPSVSNTQQPT